MKIQPWFERRFDFTFSIELFPNLCTRLRGTPARLEDIVRAASRETLVQKPGDAWSAQEHVGHLADLEPLWLARVDDFASERQELTAADLSNRKTNEANHNGRLVEEILGEFRRARADLMERIEATDVREHAHTMLHPRLKTPMRMVDHLYFAAEHDDHHLAHIWEMLRER